MKIKLIDYNPIKDLEVIVIRYKQPHSSNTSNSDDNLIENY